MKNYISLLFLICLFSQASFAQEGRTIDFASLQTKIENEAKGISSLSGSFLQVKTIASLGISIESNGKFFYKKNGNKFRWEYLSPTQFVIVYANEEFTIKQFENINQKQAANAIFTELNNILLQALNGQLKPNDNFKILAKEYDVAYTLILTPTKQELSDILKDIRLSFDKNTYSVKAITLTEQSEDTTLIQLNNLETNKPVSEDLFK